MSEAKFKCGDVVCLKSGGPAMTVTLGDRGDGLVTTCWHDADLLLRRDTFDPREITETTPCESGRISLLIDKLREQAGYCDSEDRINLKDEANFMREAAGTIETLMHRTGAKV